MIIVIADIPLFMHFIFKIRIRWVLGLSDYSLVLAAHINAPTGHGRTIMPVRDLPYTTHTKFITRFTFSMGFFFFICVNAENSY